MRKRLTALEQAQVYKTMIESPICEVTMRSVIHGVELQIKRQVWSADPKKPAYDVSYRIFTDPKD